MSDLFQRALCLIVQQPERGREIAMAALRPVPPYRERWAVASILDVALIEQSELRRKSQGGDVTTFEFIPGADREIAIEGTSIDGEPIDHIALSRPLVEAFRKIAQANRPPVAVDLGPYPDGGGFIWVDAGMVDLTADQMAAWQAFQARMLDK